jgi:hypothetical protein
LFLLSSESTFDEVKVTPFLLKNRMQKPEMLQIRHFRVVPDVPSTRSDGALRMFR